MTSATTESWLARLTADLAWLVSPSVLVDGVASVEVCCKIDILVGIGIPGMSFSATAFKIAEIEHHQPPHLERINP
jgi:hypothetical protein